MSKIRVFNEEDRAELAAIYLNCRVETFKWVSESYFKLEDFTKDTDGEKILVAVNEGRVAGFISLWMADNFIHHLFVHKDLEGLGIGEQLLNEGLKTISRPARLKCVIRNAKACTFYEKRGWTIESNSEDSVTGPYSTYLLL
jgi:GNAT superfamily N-acetyltransferase